MRLVFKPRGVNAGLNRYKGKGIYKSIGRKNTSLRKVVKDKADADPDEKIEGKGIDSVDSNIEECKKLDSDEESCTETISNFTEEEPAIDDKESNVGNDEESVSNDKVSIEDDEDSSEKVDEVTPTADLKRKYPPSIVDFLINNNTDDSTIPVPTKLQCLDSSASDCQENYVPSIAEPQPYLSNHDSRNEERLSKKSTTNHQVSLIRPTERKKWPQKKCVYCRRNYGLRNDTRYICMQCNVALCKEPCFADYHYHATSLRMSPKATT